MVKEERERFTFRVPGLLIEVIRKKAGMLGVSVNALILQILWEWANTQAE